MSVKSICFITSNDSPNSLLGFCLIDLGIQVLKCTRRSRLTGDTYQLTNGRRVPPFMQPIQGTMKGWTTLVFQQESSGYDGHSTSLRFLKYFPKDSPCLFRNHKTGLGQPHPPHTHLQASGCT